MTEVIFAGVVVLWQNFTATFCILVLILKEVNGYMIEPGTSVLLPRQMKSFSNLVPVVSCPRGGKMRDPGNEVGVFLQA